MNSFVSMLVMVASLLLSHAHGFSSSWALSRPIPIPVPVPIPTTTATTTKYSQPAFSRDTKNTRSSTQRFMATAEVGNDNDDYNDDDDDYDDGRIDLSLDERLYRIRLPRAPGIEWGTDLSFAFVSVRDLDPTGPAAYSGQVSKGDQLCELIAVPTTTTTTTTDNDPPPPPLVNNLLGASFDSVMTSFATLDWSVQEVDLVFFKGTKEELKAVCEGGGDGSADSDTITVTIVQDKGSPQEKKTTLQAPSGVNVRQLLVDNKINVYQSVTRWTNCKGKQLCGTCIINMTEGAGNTNRKSVDEGSTLRDNPDSYRLSCVTFAYGDVTVETFPPVNKDQWTR